MNSIYKIKNKIAEEVNRASGKKIIVADDIIFPPNNNFGDLSLSCFDLAKEMKLSPVETACRLVGKIKPTDVGCGVKAAGPYLNFILNKIGLVKDVINEIEKNKDDYGTNNDGKKQKILIEYSNANTHKEYHVGHLRNICYGDTINRILLANGYKAIPVSYINDFGIHIAKTIWALENFYKKEKTPIDKGYFLGKVYVRAAKEMSDNEEAKEAVGTIMKQIESRQGVEYKLWQKTRKWSIDGFAKIYKELGIKFDHIFYESEFIDEGLDIVSKLYKKEILVKSQGAIIADLEKEKLGVLMFIRSDGTALYPVADIALAEGKKKKYKPSKSIYIVDIRQGQYFKQLFSVLEKLGHKEDLIHLGYDFVKLPDGMMSSRTGNVITYKELHEQAMKKAKGETKKRHKDWSDKKITQTAEKIVIGAIKFEMIKVGADKTITFDINQALRFDGFTAAYLQYTYARINSIIQKANPPAGGQKIKKIDYSNLNHEKEGELALKMFKYPIAVKRANKDYDPSEIAKYLFELAQTFNDYYHDVSVLKAKEEIKIARLALIKSVNQTIKNGLKILGIEVVKEM